MQAETAIDRGGVPVHGPCRSRSGSWNRWHPSRQQGSLTSLGDWLSTITGRPPSSIVPAAQASSPSRLSSTSPRSFAIRGAKPKETAPIAHLSFRQAFGLLGVPMVLVLLVSIAWNAWLLILTLAPNETANYLMNTEEYDDGQFWQLADQNAGVKFLNVAGLLLIEMFNLHLLYKMLLNRTLYEPLVQRLRHAWYPGADNESDSAAANNSFAAFWDDLTGIHGVHRKFWNAGLKMSDLIMQGIVLNDFLEQGFPVLLVYGYAVFMCVNAASCALNILLAKHTALSEIIVDSIFDLIAAVVYPILILAYCYHNFEFDREVYRINIQVLPPGSFDRVARLFADPSQVALFRINFDSLRVQTPLLFMLRIVMNLSFCHRFKSVINVLIRMNRGRIHPKRPTSFRIRRQKLVPIPVALVFVGISMLVIPYAYMAIHDSRILCSRYPECVVYAYRYSWGESNQDTCPCRVLINVDRAPMTFDQWTNPVDATKSVQALAASGDLHVLQVTNRQLLELPIELRGCLDLRHISLIYTSTKVLPEWAKSWRKLQYLHVEGKRGSENLAIMPSDLFDDMPYLSFLHLALHFSLETLPALTGATNLRSVVLAHLYSLKEVPSFDTTLELERLQMIYLPLIQTLPDISHLKKLVNFAVFRPTNVCCNGFLGTCDLSHSYCDADVARGVPAATCLEETQHASPGMLRMLDKFNNSVCFQTPNNLLEFADVPTKASVDACSGVRFRQCSIVDPTTNEMFSGICNNLRMQVLSCNPDPNMVTVRELQIARGVGEQCNVEEEAWLGCRQSGR